MKLQNILQANELTRKLIRDQEEQQQIVQQIGQLNQSAGQGEIPE